MLKINFNVDYTFKHLKTIIIHNKFRFELESNKENLLLNFVIFLIMHKVSILKFGNLLTVSIKKV